MSTQWITERPDKSNDESGLNIRISTDSAGIVHVVYVVNNELRHAIGSPGQVFVRLAWPAPVASQAYHWAIHDNVVPHPSGVFYPSSI
jgi:hypothetical protein